MPACISNWLFLLGCSCLAVVAAAADREPGSEDRPFGLAKRTPWATSNFRGRPEPPLPFKAERVFPNLHFAQPTVLTSAPGTRRFFVAEQRGKIYSFPNDPACQQADLFVDVHALVEQLNQRQQPAKDKLDSVYGLTFHPQFARNRYCYVCYVVSHADGQKGQHPAGTRVCRLKVTNTDPPVCEVESEQTIITWLQGGHNGGCLKFGHDGCLYISTGDGGVAFPPDGLNSGQDVSNLLSTIIRIDVDHPEEGRNYRIPSDNPFVDLENTRGEIWAYGVRNPWKMSFDRQTGELWAGDVGWELWELVYRVRKADNFGWSITEGRQAVHAERRRGPTPIVPPAVEIPHTDGASITGGFVYRGQRFPELQGLYIFGDWETRRVWGVPVEENSVGERREVVEPTVRVVDFAEDNDGELFLLDYDLGTVHAIERNDVQPTDHRFPTRLSESGIFQNVKDHQPAAGVLPFSVNVEQWADHANSQRLVAVPGVESIRLHSAPQEIEGSMFKRTTDYPVDTVLIKTLSLDLKEGDPSSRRRVESQVLHFDGREWRGYSYQWNEDQTDATLVPAAGENQTFEVADPQAPGGKRTHAWRFASRMECIRCHNPWAEYTLAFNVPQLNRDHNYGGVVDNQLRALKHIGLLQDAPDEITPAELEAFPNSGVAREPSPETLPRLADPYDLSANLEQRARSYLHVNCAHCHRFNGGGSAHIHVPFDTPLAKTEALGLRPTQGAFGIHNAEIIAAGDPYRSVMYLRLAKMGPGHMPAIGAKMVDERGLQLMHDWIRSLPIRSADGFKVDRLWELEENRHLAQEASEAPRTRRKLAKQVAKERKREEPLAEDFVEAEKRAVAQAQGRVRQRAGERARLINELLAEPTAAMLLAKTLRERELSDQARQLIQAAASSHSNAAILDLYEPFLPDELRVRRLGEVVNAAEILKLAGERSRGEALFLKATNVQCRNCHKVGKTGGQIGPELSEIGKKLDRAKLLESILEPSKNIDPKWTTWLIETDAGLVHTGLLISKDDKRVVIRDAQNKDITLETGQIEGMYPQQKSLMPELLLRDFTAEQVADLLAYLESLK